MFDAFLIGLAIFLSGWGIVFIVSFVCAPAALDAQSQRMITDLSEKLEVPDKVLATHLAGLLEKVGPNGRDILKFILLRDEEVERRQLKDDALSRDEISGALQVCSKEGLINTRDERHGQYANIILNSFYRIPDGFRLALKRILFNPNSEIPLPVLPPKTSN